MYNAIFQIGWKNGFLKSSLQSSSTHATILPSAPGKTMSSEEIWKNIKFYKTDSFWGDLVVALPLLWPFQILDPPIWNGNGKIQVGQKELWNLLMWFLQSSYS